MRVLRQDIETGAHSGVITGDPLATGERATSASWGPGVTAQRLVQAKGQALKIEDAARRPQ